MLKKQLNEITDTLVELLQEYFGNTKKYSCILTKESYNTIVFTVESKNGIGILFNQRMWITSDIVQFFVLGRMVEIYFADPSFCKKVEAQIERQIETN